MTLIDYFQMNDGPKKKLSGWQNLKRKHEREENFKKVIESCSIKKFLKPAPYQNSGHEAPVTTHVQNDQEDTAVSPSSDSSQKQQESLNAEEVNIASPPVFLFPSSQDNCDDANSPLEECSFTNSVEFPVPAPTDKPSSSDVSHSPTTVEFEMDADQLKDPAHWPKVLNDKTKLAIIDIGPVQVITRNFPVNSSNRSFNPSYYYKNINNKEKAHRNGLVYSPKADSVYCYCCKLFSSCKNPFIDGYDDWQQSSIIRQT